MAKMSRNLLSLLFLVALFTGTYALIDCYECNLNLCTRNTTNSTECKLLEEYNNTPMDQSEKRRELWNEMEKMGGCTEKIASKCFACAKFQTTYRRIVNGGSARVDTVLSKVCAKARPTVKEDTCRKSGPSYATRHRCYCFGDLCNSAWTSRQSVSILHIAGLVILASYFHRSS